jgi:hypothetical protein
MAPEGLRSKHGKKLNGPRISEAKEKYYGIE